MHDLFSSPSASGTSATEYKAGKDGLSGGAKVGVTLSVLLCVAVMGAGYHVYKKKQVTEGDVPAVYPDLGDNLALDDQSVRPTPVEMSSPPMVDVGPEKDFDGNELRNVELL